MKKRILAAVLATASILGTVAGCDSTNTSSTAPTESKDNNSSTTEESKPEDGGETKEEGKVLNIYAWNEEFKGFFEKYYQGLEWEVELEDGTKEKKKFDKAPGLETLKGVTVNWIINPSDGGVYQQKLDAALQAQSGAAADDKVDFFLAEADYILKYTNSDFTMDVSTIGVTTADTQYNYTVQAASDADGKVKGVSFQCCPSALIYRRSIAKDVLGTDDPAEVQKKLGTWADFDAVAAQAKEKGYYMTASYVETFRTFSNNVSSAWVVNGELNIDKAIEDWTTQAATYLDKEYTLPDGVWGDQKNAQMFAEGKTMCFFGPAWYYNFCMGNAMDKEKGCYGDWAVTTGPQEHFWGGTWILAATGTDNPTIVADIMKAFTVNEDVCSALIENEAQFTNNSKVNEKYATDPKFGNAFLGGQNDVALFVELAKGIKFEHKTNYDQLLSEKYPEYMLDYFQKKITKDEALANFYKFVNDTYADVKTP
ncbi:MAG: carbohydrate ABC transporter substrate-binding protein [Ruminiclostridium sp.]|nr:carbohydrate ABC transporter substrate-binding protein [Ruminiclostridium sp.]